MIIRNWYILDKISLFPSAHLKLRNLQVERVSLIFPCDYCSLRSKTASSHLKKARLWSTAAILLQLEHTGMKHAFLHVLCLSIHEHPHEAKLWVNAVSNYREEEYQSYGISNHEGKWIWLNEYANANLQLNHELLLMCKIPWWKICYCISSLVLDLTMLSLMKGKTFLKERKKKPTRNKKTKLI